MFRKNADGVLVFHVGENQTVEKHFEVAAWKQTLMLVPGDYPARLLHNTGRPAASLELAYYVVASIPAYVLETHMSTLLAGVPVQVAKERLQSMPATGERTTYGVQIYAYQIREQLERAAELAGLEAIEAAITAASAVPAFGVGARVRLTADLTRYHDSLTVGTIGTQLDIDGAGYVSPYTGGGGFITVAFPEHTLPMLKKSLEPISFEAERDALLKSIDMRMSRYPGTRLGRVTTFRLELESAIDQTFVMRYLRGYSVELLRAVLEAFEIYVQAEWAEPEPPAEHGRIVLEVMPGSLEQAEREFPGLPFRADDFAEIDDARNAEIGHDLEATLEEMRNEYEREFDQPPPHAEPAGLGDARLTCSECGAELADDDGFAFVCGACYPAFAAECSS